MIAGPGLAYAPIDIHTKATAYRDERGFFGDRSRTFEGLPSGRNVFAGVLYDIYEMPTSPVPQVLMLGGRGVPGSLPGEIRGIPVNRKADALFFLHAARIDERRDDRQRREKARLELFRYIIHYADGGTEDVPVRSEIDIEHYVQEEPRMIPGAQIAWTAPFEGGREKAVAYSMQWNNPRPGVEIASVDMVHGEGRRGVPVLLAITAATAR